MARVEHDLVDRSVLRLLAGIGYTMQANVKTREGADHHRDTQSQYVNDTAAPHWSPATR